MNQMALKSKRTDLVPPELAILDANGNALGNAMLCALLNRQAAVVRDLVLISAQCRAEARFYERRQRAAASAPPPDLGSLGTGTPKTVEKCKAQKGEMRC